MQRRNPFLREFRRDASVEVGEGGETLEHYRRIVPKRLVLRSVSRLPLHGRFSLYSWRRASMGSICAARIAG